MHTTPFVQTSSADEILQLMQSRKTLRPRHLESPGLDAAQLQLILQAAATAPDHGAALPWRFVQVPDAAREALAEVFGQALHEREPDAADEQVERAREKAFRSPTLLLAIVRRPELADDMQFAEVCTSTGAALQNMLLVATAMGFSSGLTSGSSLQSRAFRHFFALGAHEYALCFASFGMSRVERKVRERPQPAQFCSVLSVHATVESPELVG